MKISYSFGILDLFHYGHLKALKEAAEGSDLHVVGLVSDGAAREWLGNIVSNETERREVLKNISCVDWVMPQQTLDPTENLRKLHHIYPDAQITLFRGDDTSIVVAREYLKSIGGKVKTINYYEKLSPMEILKALNSRVDITERNSGLVSTKANTLLAIRDRLTKASIEQIYVAAVKDVQKDEKAVAENIRRLFQGKRIVVRSSSLREDGFEFSNAGHYESIIGVDSNDPGKVANAVRTVWQSYAKDGAVDPDEQILIQTQTENVKYSGVVFTRDIQRNRPYYIINYDDAGATDSVTGGGSGKVIWIAQDASDDAIAGEWRSLWEAVKELEQILKGMLLDIEFAVKADGQVIIFQVRPLAASYRFGRNALIGNLLGRKNEAKDQYRDYVRRTGDRLLSDMAFWNPAEIIGDNPDRLAYSLYKEIVTHDVWNEGLVPMGYRKVPGDLMYRFGNKPYISLERSFRSLMPSKLKEGTAKKLENYYCDALRADLSAHDKIEFEIVYSCFDFQVSDRLRSLLSLGFSEDEIEEIYHELFLITDWSVRNFSRILKQDMESLQILEGKRRETEIRIKDAESIQEMAAAAAQLIDAIRKYGTPQFARQARFAFMAKSLCLSLLKKGYWGRSTYDGFMESLETVASRFEKDLKRMQQGRLSREKFDEEYGHLRAGTYEISCQRYDELHFEKMDKDSGIFQGEPEKQDGELREGVIRAMEEKSVPWDEEELLSFLKCSMEQREYFKFMFTRSLSRVIEIFADIGRRLGYDRQAVSCLEVQEILGFSIYSDSEDAVSFIRDISPYRAQMRREYSKIIMPDVITSADDFDFVCPIDSRPNFITVKKAAAETVMLSEGGADEIAGKIVVVEKADPGYDWIFSKEIAGLITKFGGTASHMAIRCAEFEIPAAIGCGEKIFSYVAEGMGKRLELDCGKGVLKYMAKAEGDVG